MTKKQWQMRILALDVSDTVIARLAGVSVLTVLAWKSGEVANAHPHYSIRDGPSGEYRECSMAPCCYAFEEKKTDIQAPAQAPAKRHPMQEVILDKGVARFRKNEIVTLLLDSGPVDLNHIEADETFSKEDKEQFMMLIGTSVSGSHDSAYISDELCEEADREVKRLLRD